MKTKRRILFEDFKEWAELAVPYRRPRSVDEEWPYVACSLVQFYMPDGTEISIFTVENGVVRDGCRRIRNAAERYLWDGNESRAALIRRAVAEFDTVVDEYCYSCQLD